jgi:hypothetical protein
LPLKARYYRTGSTIKGGNIKSTATFTIEYSSRVQTKKPMELPIGFFVTESHE